MGKPYAPPGFIGLIDATRLVASRSCPERWAEHAIPKIELAVWEGLGTSLDATMLRSHMNAIARIRTSDCVKRIADFEAARDLLRDRLCGGQISACFFDQGGEVVYTPPEWWRGASAEQCLETGVAYWADEAFPETEVCRGFLLRAADLAETANGPEAQIDAIAVSYKTGFAGRPSAMHLVIPEAKRRLEAGHRPENLKSFTEDLAVWVKNEHPDAPQPTPKAIQNNPELRKLYHRFKPGKAQKPE